MHLYTTPTHIFQTIADFNFLFIHLEIYRKDDAVIELPPFDIGQSGDIYFEFKTTWDKTMVLIHTTGLVSNINIFCLLFVKRIIVLPGQLVHDPLLATPLSRSPTLESVSDLRRSPSRP